MAAMGDQDLRSGWPLSLSDCTQGRKVRIGGSDTEAVGPRRPRGHPAVRRSPMDKQEHGKQEAVPLWALPSCSETGGWTAFPLPAHGGVGGEGQRKLHPGGAMVLQAAEEAPRLGGGSVLSPHPHRKGNQLVSSPPLASVWIQTTLSSPRPERRVPPVPVQELPEKTSETQQMLPVFPGFHAWSS